MDLTGLDGQASFFDGLAGRLGTARADHFCSLTGYEALRDRRFPVAGGLELVRTHPEAFRSAAHRSAWVAPVTGFHSLVDALRDYLASRGVTMLHSTRLVRAESGRDGLDLELLTGDRQRLRLATQQVALTRWKDSDLGNCCIVTDNELQKLYFDTGRRTVYFYCDSSNAQYWATLRDRGERAFRDTLTAKIEQAAGRALPELSQAEELVSRYWPIGITYLEQGAALDGAGCVRIADRIQLSTGAFTGNPGWIEGVLTNASRLAAGLTGPPEAREHRVVARHARARNHSGGTARRPQRVRRVNCSMS